MFCSNCGQQVSSKQKFCSHCGAENQNVTYDLKNENLSNDSYSQSSGKAQINTLFNRDVLINYLNNLQTLEFAKHKLNQEKRDMEYRIDSLCIPRSVGYVSIIEDCGAFLGLSGLAVVVFFISLWINSGLKGDGFLSIFDGLLGPIITFIMFVAVVVAIGSIIFAIGCYISSRREVRVNTKNEENRLEVERVKKEQLTSILPLVENDLTKTSDLLNAAYAINIIPAKYRNIYAVYFLYEYISTSAVSLNEALYHCDLDEISKKLDTIIEQQQEIIMELARSNALNEQIVRQNEETLKHAIAVENNTALAAQYSQVAAINSNTVSQIQSYYFFKNAL